MTWVEYGVLLGGGVIAPAASERQAWQYGPDPGYPVVSRTVTSTPRGRGGDATVDFGPWAPLRGVA